MRPPPPGFERFAAGNRRLWVDARLADAALRAGLLEPDGWERALRAGGGPAGRAQTALVALPGCGRRLHLRPVRHGGAFAGLLGDRLLGLARPLSELAAAAALARAGAPVVRPVLVAARRRAGPLWTAAVGTLHEEDASDGVAFLEAAPGRERVLHAAEAAGRAVRRFHDAGGRHADLHVKNLLLRESGAAFQAWLVDLDRARAGAPPPAGRRMAELARLYRSLVKRSLLDAVGADGCARFFAAYAGGDGALAHRLLAYLPRERRRLALHAWRY
jgi:3-deoxy-D-manno-octulosonic acid kinase